MTKAHVSTFDPWVEIHTANLRHNAAEVARLAKRPVLAVIKNNGYGLGAVNVAKVLDDQAAIAGFAVVKVQEALGLRDEGIKKPVLLMGPVDEVDLRLIVSRNIMPMVYTPIGDLLQREADRRWFTGRSAICVCVEPASAGDRRCRICVTPARACDAATHRVAARASRSMAR